MRSKVMKMTISAFTMLTIFTVLMGTVAAMIAIGPITSLDSGGPYSIYQGNKVNLKATVDVEAFPYDWESIINDPDAEVKYDVSYYWDLDNDGEYDDAEGHESGKVTGTALEVTNEIDTEFFKIYPYETYDIEVMAIVSISGGNDEAGYISYYPDTQYDSTSIEIMLEKPLIANAGGPYSGTAGLPITFDGRASYDIREIKAASIFMLASATPEVGIESYEWDFDDDGEYDDATGSVVEHIFDSPGNYPVALKVASYDGFQETDTTSVEVSATQNSEEIPEFPMLVVPIAAIVSIAFVIQRRKN